MDEFVAPYQLPDPDNHPGAVALELLKLPEFGHLRDGEAKIEWLMRKFEKIKAGRRVLGTCYMPMVQGELRDMFEWLLYDLFKILPDFLIVIDNEYWQEAGARDREILVYHELMHCGQKVDQYGEPKFTREGLPCWAILGHDVEEFVAVVRRYGAHSGDIQRFIEAAEAGARPVRAGVDNNQAAADVF